MNDDDKKQPQDPAGNSNFTIKNDETSVENPLDPNDNFRDVINDASGLTGISADYNDQSTPPQNTGPDTRTMSDAKYAQSIGQNQLDDSLINEQTNPMDQTDANGLVNSSPGEKGEESVSGDMPDPDSDDDTLENEHQVGLRLNEDSEHPQELDVASDIDKAEEYHRNH